MTLFVFLRECAGWRLLGGRLRGEVGGLRVVLVGAWSGGCVQGVVACFAFLVGYWTEAGECGVFRFEVCLFRFVVVGVTSCWRVVCGGSGRLGPVTHGCV